MADPRKFDVVSCFDCGYVGNRPDIHKGVQYAMEKPWDENVCPECGESAGAFFVVHEVVPSSTASTLVEAVAKKLFEYATWHPPKPGRSWAGASAYEKAAWRDEADDLLAPFLSSCSEDVEQNG